MPYCYCHISTVIKWFFITHYPCKWIVMARDFLCSRLRASVVFLLADPQDKSSCTTRDSSIFISFLHYVHWIISDESINDRTKEKKVAFCSLHPCVLWFSFLKNLSSFSYKGKSVDCYISTLNTFYFFNLLYLLR